MVLGQSGELGSRLIKKLLTAGYEVIGFSRTNKYEMVHPLFNFYSKDLLNPGENLEFSRFRPDVLIFCSWITRPIEFWESPENLLWVDSSIRIISEFEKFGGKYLIMSGSCAEYLWDSTLPLSEFSPEMPQSLYGKSKLQVLDWLRTRKINFLWTRTFYQFGQLEAKGRLIPSLIDSISNNCEYIISNPLDEIDFVYIEDVVEIIFILFTNNAQGVYNIGTGVGQKIQDISNLILELMNGNSKLLTFKYENAISRKVISDPSKLNSVIGGFTWTNFKDSLMATILSRTSL